ncbi:ATP-binding cassette domain-containing protein [Thermomonospora umbrina]|uniref:UvrABC system protein A n=1 Tax=Thermomonospora umbrina TaxID=111806 RepID=A0A3D9SKS7_9ACTN|nr:excinuclease ABC subunit UvrA [Thermomonospora umbrina]REE96526.1 excinuclease ABC A subunit [Thermomonospora umbrina]
MNDIVLRGARVNNLRDVSVRIPKQRLTVFTGVSGSGKSSLVFGTIAAESQHQLNQMFPAFVRHRLARRERPDADAVENLSTAVVVDQRPVGGNSRSTVGTMTEIHPLLRVLFSRCGTPGAGPSTAYSFNDPQGMCPECDGLGHVARVDVGRLLDEDRTLNEGAIRFPPYKVGTAAWQLYAESGLFDPDKPLRDFTERERELLLHGGGFRVKRASRRGVYQNEYEGVVRAIDRRYLKRRPGKGRLDDALEEIAVRGVCPACRGARLNAAALASTIDGRNIADLTAMEITDLIAALERIDDPIAAPMTSAALAALRRIEAVGLGYLSLDRATSTLSGGEGQRLKTVRHLGSSLTDLTFIFDEPSVGLHPRDVHRLGDLLLELRDKGNTVLVVEHHRDIIALADHVIDMGPGAGARGGHLVFEGPVTALRESDTLTGRMLRRPLRLKDVPRRPTGALTIADAGRHNLRDITVDLPTGVLTAVTGVAGSGKSTLVSRVLPEQHPDTVLIDQSAIGVSTRSTPATYLDVMDPVRRLFAAAHGVDAGLFSFNSAGACPACQGRGEIQTDLAYLEPVTTTCEVCGGHRYRPEALQYTLHGLTIADVLEMTAAEALAVFEEAPVADGLTALREVGLDHLTLGRSLSTLSGGERQRLKLAERLRKRETGGVYVFDEPTTGLHMADVEGLLALLDRLVDRGHTVIVIEHDLDVVARADHVIDLGPEAGSGGGRVIFEGPPTALVDAAGSHTAAHLRRELTADAAADAERAASRPA